MGLPSGLLCTVSILLPGIDVDIEKACVVRVVQLEEISDWYDLEMLSIANMLSFPETKELFDTVVSEAHQIRLRIFQLISCTVHFDSFIVQT